MKKLILLFAAAMPVVTAAQAQQEAEVSIGGVVWATRNVGAKGTFVSTPEQYGNHYTFEEAQTACPEGWRTPTMQEFESLDSAGSEWTNVSRIYGRRFGSGNNTILLPAAGFRSSRSDAVSEEGASGHYWSSTERISANGHHLYFSRASVYPDNFSSYAFGFSVRCVRSTEGL